MSLIKHQIYELANLQEIAEQTKEYILNAKSSNTRKAYRSDWKDFCGWCEGNGLQSLPASHETVTAYLTDKAATLKVASLDRRLVSIRQAHVMAGHPLDKNHPLITETMKGIKNIHGAPQTAKAPIMIEDLRSMVQSLGCDLKGARDKALLLLGFTGALRRSELVGLKVEDLHFAKEGIEVVLKKSKTDQTGEGATLAIPYGSNPETCPVRSVQEWLALSGVAEGFVFRSVNRHGHIGPNGLCGASVAMIIKRNAHLAGKEAVYSGHSLRAGFCTTAATKGIPEHSIMRQSRHKKSDTLRKYIRMGSLWKDNAATKLGL